MNDGLQEKSITTRESLLKTYTSLVGTLIKNEGFLCNLKQLTIIDECYYGRVYYSII